MNYQMFFDESNKLDQPNVNYSFYGALGLEAQEAKKVSKDITDILHSLNSTGEMHFSEYKNDKNLERYLRVLTYLLNQEIKLNIMIVNKEDAEAVSGSMRITMLDLRELFYVKIPERLFYGLTRELKSGDQVSITIDENTEYTKLELETKLGEQMNAHSAYRKKGYKVVSVSQESSEENVLLQVTDVLLGIVAFLVENKYSGEDKVVNTLLKSDLLYRLLAIKDNAALIQDKITLFKWDSKTEQVDQINISEYLGSFFVHKARFDAFEVARLARLVAEYPNETSKFYRQKMGYTNNQLRTLKGYLAELNGEDRNDFIFNNT